MEDSIVAGSVSKKRVCEDSDQVQEFEQKRAKIRDLESVFRSEGKIKSNIDSAIDLNAKDDNPSSVEDTSHLKEGTNFVKSRGFPIDLNSEDVSSSMIHDPFLPYKDYDFVKPRDALSECGSTCGVGGEPDSMRRWKEMKQNGFLSSAHGGVPVPQIPKPRGRKKGNEAVIKKKIEIAKKEQVNRFAKVAAPSGLLNELNPGIINHVRNRKQVHSIIENLVRSARKDNKHSGSKQENGKESGQYDDLREHNDMVTSNRELGVKMNYYSSHNKLECGEDILALKLLPSTNTGSGVTSSLSNDESGNLSTVNSLSVKAASVASQWLELLHQDLKGRLAALRHSKKRVQTVIQTELPLLVSQELVSYQENYHSENGHLVKGTVDLHKTRWGSLFDQMENALSEEETKLENSLNQVNEMLIHCEHGLLQFHPENVLQRHTNDYRFLKAESSPYKDLAVPAAAAAIYSTSNFLQSMENLPCF
uniref:uncharacterized protein LOC122589658 n=1 Tax=Erigeron canadensis TaxID=72917 RepID=UPI001CB8DA57|nr:uncharacterized protein LOC122589658 [Erigeron canadensis]